ncbi:MAG: hypothetical protein LBM75_00120 [Myxococcales bacterium]|jgi:hypothetical protein|nr:hypothetical protein [Myxococcales bacterium]
MNPEASKLLERFAIDPQECCSGATSSCRAAIRPMNASAAELLRHLHSIKVCLG